MILSDFVWRSPTACALNENEPVFIPHGNTWVLEHDEVAAPTPPSRLLTIEKFSQLRDHF